MVTRLNTSVITEITNQTLSVNESEKCLDW